MPRRATTPLEPNENARVKREKVKVKEEKNKGKQRARIDEEEEQDAAPEEGHLNNEEEEQETGSPRGSKRRRTNVGGDSAPTGSPSQEDQEDEVVLPRVKTLPRGSDGFIPGSIVRIKLNNFVTYDAVEFRPGPYLNMIIGPNGTGKSSISCAIALGLNFSPLILGRATELHSYVKHGASNGSIEIELKAPENKRNIIIRRTLTASAKGSSFTINGAAATGKEVTMKVAELNVQVGNLCSFLPQDRVSEFAAMTPQDLLKETQRAAGDENLTKWHTTLINAGNELRDIQQKIKDEENSLKQMKERNENIERDVQRFLERKKIQFQIDMLEVLIPVAEYREIRMQCMELKKQQRTLHKKVTKLKARNAPAHALLQKFEDDYKKAEHERDVLKKSTQTKFKNLTKKDQELTNLAKSADSIVEEIIDLKSNENTRKAQITKYEADVARQRQHIEDTVPPDPDLDKELQDEIARLKSDNQQYSRNRIDYNEQLRGLHQQKASLNQTLDNAERDMKQLDNVYNQKLAQVKKMDKTTHDAIEWLRDNKDKFKMEVFETPVMRLDIKDRRYASAVESCFNFNQLKTFVTQCQEDCDTLNKYINDDHVLGRGRKINTWFRPIQEDALIPPPLSPQEMQDLGFDGYALDYVECPPAMRWFLMREVNLHRTAISLSPIKDLNNAMNLVSRPTQNHPGGATFISGNSINNVTRSRYGKKAMNNMTRDLNDARSFTVPMVDPEAKRAFEDTIHNCKTRIEMIDNERTEIGAKQNDIDRKLKDFDQRVKEIKDRRDKLMKIQTELVKAKSKLEATLKSLKELKAQPPPDEKRKELKEKLSRINQKRLKIAKEYTDLVHAIIDEQEQCTRVGLKCLQINANRDALKELCEQKEKKLTDTATLYTQVNDSFKECKQLTREILVKSRQMLEDAPEEVKEEYAKIETRHSEHVAAVKEAKENNLPPPENPHEDKRTSDELQAELETQKANLEMNLGANPGVVEQYEQRKRNIEQLEITLTQRRKEEEKIAKNIKNARDNWQPALQSLVSSIGQKFSAAFDRIGCAGEIRINENEDYAQWAIDILVKFRSSEKLQLLTAHRQSGGERSLTTILYLMSLTEEARAPFSLVDEINQGMDQRAERVVHNSMVNVTCKPDSAQYFLITPKLLPDLEYHERMKILCVNNGEWLPENGGGMGKMMDMIKVYEASKRQHARGAM